MANEDCQVKLAKKNNTYHQRGALMNLLVTQPQMGKDSAIDQASQIPNSVKLKRPSGDTGLFEITKARFFFSSC